jgi:hypothetical protein
MIAEMEVEPIANESTLRNWDWIESNRKKVDELSNGKIGDAYLPNAASGGFTYFNRMFFAPIDERRNEGGQAANNITDVLISEYLASWEYRSCDMTLSTPVVAIYGQVILRFSRHRFNTYECFEKQRGKGLIFCLTLWLKHKEYISHQNYQDNTFTNSSNSTL